jgi:hypothetical protein
MSDLKNRHNDIVHKIMNYVKNQKIQFSKDNFLKVRFTSKTNYCVNVTIMDDDTWDEIKRRIDIRLNYKREKDCSICFNSFENTIKVVFCYKCSKVYCTDCYINIFRMNMGIIKCPFCRFEFGYIHSASMIETGVQELLNTIG